MSTSEKYVALSVMRKQSMLAKAYDTYLILLDATNGKKMMELPMKDKNKGDLSLIALQVDQTNNQVLLMGEYYNPGDEVLKDQSQGLYAKRVDMNGNEVAMAKYSWANEIAKFRKENLTTEQQSKDNGKRLLYIHKIMVSATGDIYAIGEEYRKTVSGLGTAANLMNKGNSGVSNFQLTIGNLALIHLNSKLELADYKLIEKKISRVLLPSGYGINGAEMLAAYVKATGGFDYQFTSVDMDKGTYTVVYKDMDRKSDESDQAADVMIGTISIKGENADVNRYPINSSAKYIGIQPAKPGYIMILEYFRKTKKLDMHLEKI